MLVGLRVVRVVLEGKTTSSCLFLHRHLGNITTALNGRRGVVLGVGGEVVSRKSTLFCTMREQLPPL